MSVAYLLRLCGVIWMSTSSAATWLTISLAASPRGLPEHDTANVVAFDGLVMFAGLNVGMGLYLIVASTNPVKYRYVVDMFVLSQMVCGLSVAALRIWAPAYHGRWGGQMLMAAFGAAVVALIWCPVRARVAAESRPGGSKNPPSLAS